MLERKTGIKAQFKKEKNKNGDMAKEVKTGGSQYDKHKTLDLNMLVCNEQKQRQLVDVRKT